MINQTRLLLKKRQKKKAVSKRKQSVSRQQTQSKSKLVGRGVDKTSKNYSENQVEGELSRKTDDEFAARSVPVLVDSIKHESGFEMTRCVYFSIESDIPTAGWQLRLGEEVEAAFLMLGFSGILYQPINGPGYFDAPEKIETLYAAIEESPDLYVDTNDVWLPNSLFITAHDGKMGYEGQVFRIAFELFISAWQYRNGQLEKDMFRDIGGLSDAGAVRLSRVESEAFEKWRMGLIDETRERYYKSKNRLEDRFGRR